MNGNTDKKRKIMQSLSAFAFALTVFAANAQGSASAVSYTHLTLPTSITV